MPGTGLSFLYGESVARCAHRIDKTFADYHTLQYMSAGGVELTVGADSYLLEGAWFWSAYPGPRIRFHAAAGYRHWRHRYIAFRGPRINRWRKLGLFPISPQRPPRDAAYGDCFDALLSCASGGGQWGELRAVNLLERILLELAEARTQAQSRSAWLEKVTARLRSNADLDYARVSAELGMSQRTLRRRFAAAMGLSPHEYALQARVAEARRLLGETDLSTKAIADRLGYRDVYFFSRQFRQLAGVPPAAYRRSRQG